MSQDTEKYLYFKVGLLKDSFALEALWQDALKYHMIDQPAKLIAMRLTEYYELTNKGSMQQSRATTPPPTASTSTPPTPRVFTERDHKEDVETPTSSTPAVRLPANSPVAQLPAIRPVAPPPTTPVPNTKLTSTTADPIVPVHREGETSLAVSAEVDQNAEEAADYWSLL